MRPATACHTCRLSKRKCRPSKDDRGIGCARCHRQKLPCSFIFRQPLVAATESSSGLVPISRPVQVQPDDHEIRKSALGWHDEMVEHYFNVVHDTHHSLFHRPAFEADLASGNLADVILFAVVSLGARFTGQRSDECQRQARVLGADYAEKAHRALDIRDVSIKTVQGCILLGTLCYVDGKSAAEAVYYATAARLAIILDLPRRHCISELERQINLRVWWTLYMIDIWSSAGLQLSRQLSYQDEIDLPMDERVYLSLQSDTPRDQIYKHETGIWGQMARLSHLWAQIQDLNRAAVQQNLSPMAQTGAIDSLSQQLRDWSDSLPPSLKESPENLRTLASRGLGTAFAALHLGFHYYHEVLYYQFMAENHQSPSHLADGYAGECARHARAFCDLLYLCEETPGCKCLYAMVGHMLVVTSTVYVHMLLFGSMSSPASEMRGRLEHNFEILTELQAHWTTLDKSLARLKVFHNACLYSIEHSFSMDRWMLRFILEHGTSMPEKFQSFEGAVGGDSPDHRTLRDWYAETLS